MKLALETIILFHTKIQPNKDATSK
jgi:hypothetical protein